MKMKIYILIFQGLFMRNYLNIPDKLKGRFEEIIKFFFFFFFFETISPFL